MTAEAPASAPRRAVALRDAVLEALRGTPMDFTSGNLGRAVVLLAIPMVIEMMGESLFAIVDALWVSRLGASALAAVGLTESLLEIVYSVAVGLSMATTAMVARRVGERNESGAAAAAVQAILVGITTGVVLGTAGWLAAPKLLRFMGADANVIAVGHNYTRWMYGGMTWILLLFLNNAIFRGAGDAATAMRSLWVANLTNLVLDPCFIFGLGPFPRLGLTGAAVATNIGRATGVLFQLSRLLRPGRRLLLTRPDLRPDLQVMRRLLRLSVGGIGQFLIATASYVGLVRILATFGSHILAGYVIAIRIVIFVLMPAWGLSNAAATLVGQNLGARQPGRAERSVWITGLYNMTFMCGVAVIFVLCARPVIGLFTHDPQVLPTGVEALRIVSYGYGFYAWGMVMTNAFNGAGDTFTPTAINFFCFWTFQIPMAWLLSRHTGLGPQGVFWAIAASYSMSAVVGFALFRRGRWKTRQV